jgi:hypothetical protein
MIGHMTHFLCIKAHRKFESIWRRFENKKQVHILWLFLAPINKSFAYAKGPSQYNEMISNS